MEKLVIDALNLPPTVRIGDGPLYQFAAGSSIEILWDSDDHEAGKVTIVGRIQRSTQARR